jgi:hypothetical protein
VTSDRFADRLDAATYEHDEVVGVYETTPDDKDSLLLSERLVQRLARIAAAYELHTLPMIGGSDPAVLNRQRCQALVDELVFVAERLDDPVAITTAQTIQDYVAARLRRPGWSGDVTVDGN